MDRCPLVLCTAIVEPVMVYSHGNSGDLFELHLEEEERGPLEAIAPALFLCC
jgi:hypothetical protein